MSIYKTNLTIADNEKKDEGEYGDRLENMKAEHLNRKTHFKKINGRSFSGVQLHDLTTEMGIDEKDTLQLSDFHFPDEADTGYLKSLPCYFNNEEDVITWAGGILFHSPLARSLWEDAGKKGWSVGLSVLENGGFYLDVRNKKILLDRFSMTPLSLGRSTYFRNALLTTLIRALRDVWHENRTGSFEDCYGPEDVLMLERIRSADSDAITILAGWEIRGAGFSDVWRHLLGAEEGDMAIVFTRVLERRPTALYDGSVLLQTFYQWFEDEGRVNGTDHETLEALDSFLQSSASQNPFGQKKPSAYHIEALAKLPDGTSYLSNLGQAVMDDPFFAGLGDPINQTHLFHLIHDMETYTVNNVPFRDRKLARMIFPQGEISSSI